MLRWTLHPPVTEWLQDNLEARFKFITGPEIAKILFESNADAISFKMRWWGPL